MRDLSAFCVYTMLHSAKLAAQMRTGGTHQLTERKAWRTGHLLWDQARRSGELMPVVFSAAEADKGLIYWAIIDNIEIDDVTRETTCTYSDLRAITQDRPKSSLRLRRTGNPLSEDSIRPYAICHTPDFLA